MGYTSSFVPWGALNTRKGWGMARTSWSQASLGRPSRSSHLSGLDLRDLGWKSMPGAPRTLQGIF